MIPIQNLYYLLCYAWNRLPERAELLATQAQAFHRPLELLTHVLLTATRRYLRQGLPVAYAERTEELTELRGRVELASTLSQNLLRRGRAVCTFDELGIDTPLARLLRGTLQQLSRTRSLPVAARHEVRLVVRRFPVSVTAEPVTQAGLRAVYRLRPGGLEGLLLSICTLIHHSSLPSPDAKGATRFRDFRRDEQLMARIFEQFVRNFYRLEQRRFRVLSETIPWQAEADTGDALGLLPAMITDTTLESSERKIILDTKYYAAALRQRYNQQKLISPHLYQLYAYLQNQPPIPEQKLEGILLYPAASQALDVRYTLGGHPIRIVTIDLAQPWEQIAAGLLASID